MRVQAAVIGSAAASAAATGIDTATRTPGGQFIPPFVKGMAGR